MLHANARRRRRLASLLRAGLLALTGLTACNVSLWMEDGIPRNGMNSSSTTINGHIQMVVAWGDDGDGYRFEWKGRGMPGVAPGDADFELTGDGELMLARYEDGSRVAEVRIVSTGGEVTRTWQEEGVTGPYEPDGAVWLAEALPDVINAMGLGAETRVPRLYAEGGLAAVLADVALRETDAARGQYYEFIVGSPAFSSEEVAAAVLQAGRQLGSDAHLEDVLEEAIEARPGDAVVLDGVLVAAASIDSDAHLEDVLEVAVEEGGAQGAQLVAVLEVAARFMDSDAHLADLLETVASENTLDETTTPAFLEALASVGSDAHAADVAEDVVGNPGTPAGTLASLLTAIGPQISSDAHLADILEEVPRARLADPAVRRAFLAAVSTLESDAHAVDVLEDFIHTSDPAVLADFIDAATATVGSDAHMADLLDEVPASALQDARVRASLRAAVATIGSEAHRESILRRLPDGALDG